MHQWSHHDVGELEPLNELLADGDGDPTSGCAVQLTEIVDVSANEITHLVQVMLRPMRLLQHKDVRDLGQPSNLPPPLPNELSSRVMRAEESHSIPGSHPDRGVTKGDP